MKNGGTINSKIYYIILYMDIYIPEWRDYVDIGKIPNDLLEKLVISRTGQHRSDILSGPGVGKDCSIIDFGEYVCVLSTDPITGAVNRIGYLGVHISCNDIATTGAEPVGILVTIMAPPNSTLDDIEKVMEDVEAGAKELKIGILGGHTEVTDAVKQMILSVTAVGKAKKEEILQPSKVRTGDDVVVTKTVGLEGTAILAYDRSGVLEKYYGSAFVKRAQNYISCISVVREGRIAAQFGANAMHDATEGGILGAVWEMSEGIGKGILIYKEHIPIEEETDAICRFFQINPLRLISSGTMVIIVPNGQKLVEELKKNDINSAVIGKVVDKKGVWMMEGGKKKLVDPPKTDELYKAMELSINEQSIK